jgi:hypothetical protein
MNNTINTSNSSIAQTEFSITSHIAINNETVEKDFSPPDKDVVSFCFALL